MLAAVDVAVFLEFREVVDESPVWMTASEVAAAERRASRFSRSPGWGVAPAAVRGFCGGVQAGGAEGPGGLRRESSWVMAEPMKPVAPGEEIRMVVLLVFRRRMNGHEKHEGHEKLGRQG